MFSGVNMNVHSGLSGETPRFKNRAAPSANARFVIAWPSRIVLQGGL
jgi:hypothetical protein